MPCVVDLAAMRAAMKRAGGDPQKINPLVPVDLVIDHSVQVDEFGIAVRAVPQRRRRNSSAIANDTSSSSGGRRRSTNFRVVPPATGIVHQVNLEYLGKVVQMRDGVRVSRFAGRHRLAHDDDQRPGRRRLGRRRDRGRGVHARPADLHGHAAGRRLQAPRQAARRLDRDRSGADDHADPPQPRRGREIRRVLRRRSGEHVGRRPRDDRQHGARNTARRSASSRSTSRRSTYLRSDRRDRKQIDLVERYCKEQGLWRQKNSEPEFSENAGAGSGHGACRASPARVGRRIASNCAA